MPTKIKIYNQKAEEVGDLKLSDKVFGVKTNEALVHQAYVTQMSNERQVLAHTKDRSEVRGGGRKPWRQKGTGRARAGSRRSPIWIGGGVTFGPRSDRNFKKKINKKMRQKALLMVLSDKATNDNLLVLNRIDAKGYKTKAIDEMLGNLENILEKGAKTQKHPTSPRLRGAGKNTKTPSSAKATEGKQKHKRSVLIINHKVDKKVKYSGRNLVGVEIININNLNIVDLLKYRNLVLTEKVVKKLEERLVSN